MKQNFGHMTTSYRTWTDDNIGTFSGGGKSTGSSRSRIIPQDLVIRSNDMQRKHKAFASSDLCNNCGKYGHIYKNCKLPITSIGIILFRNVHDSKREYLIIRRKDTLGYVDFLRGKYVVSDTFYILNMIKQMTQSERVNLLEKSFDELWNNLWNIIPTKPGIIMEDSFDTSTSDQKDLGFADGPPHDIKKQYKTEEHGSRKKFQTLRDNGTLKTLIEEANKTIVWQEAEWGFPKGRRNYQENDFECAVRELREETGLNLKNMRVLKNVIPYEEVFSGSNYKSYKHKYYLVHYNQVEPDTMDNFDKGEVSDMKWKSYSECVQRFRPYNTEKLRILGKVETALSSYSLTKGM